MAIVSCNSECNGIDFSAWQTASEIERIFLIYCALVGGPPPIVNYGTTEFAGDTANDGAVVIPQDWSTFAVTNLVTSTSNVTVGSLSLPPGVSIGHGSWDRFFGDPITVTSPDPDTTAIVSWTIAVPTP
jgi:hypothetical protein